MLDETEYARWIEASRRALRSAVRDREGGDYNWACFKAQHSAELAVKGLLYGLGLAAHGHSVARLMRKLAEGLRVRDELIERAKDLDKFYIPTRYPNAWVEGIPSDYYTLRDAENAIRGAEDVLAYVEGVWRSLRGEGSRGRG